MGEKQDGLTMPVPRLRGRRFKQGAAFFACLMILPATGVALLTLLAFREASRPRTQQNGIQVTGINRSSVGIAPTSRSLREMLANPDIIPTHHHPLLGRPAPDFELLDLEGKTWHIRELMDGHPTVLLFSYGFHCLHCVRQLSAINRDLPLFHEVGARVIAISADSPELTRRLSQQHGDLGFSILSDPDNKVAQAYGVFRTAPDGQAVLRHGTFVIDRDGMVQWVNVGDAPFSRNSALLYQLARIEDGRQSLQAGPADLWAIAGICGRIAGQ